MTRFLIKILNIFSEKIGRISSLLVLFLILLVSVSVILRYIFSIGFIWIQDLYIWIHAIFILLGISYTLKMDNHVRIDLLYRNFNKKKRNLINLIGLIIFAIPLTYILLVNGLDYFTRSYNLNEGSKESGGLPNIYILKFFIFFLGILLLLEICRQILSFFNKDELDIKSRVFCNHFICTACIFSSCGLPSFINPGWNCDNCRFYWLPR